MVRGIGRIGAAMLHMLGSPVLVVRETFAESLAFGLLRSKIANAANPPNASMWPPHRRAPTQPRRRNGRRYTGNAQTIRQAMRQGGRKVRVDHPGKYLHASRTLAHG